MIALNRIRNLDLANPPAAGRPAHLSAASGLARVGSFIYVVADDELHLGVFRHENREPGRLIRLFDGELPDAKPERKRRKPDLEALTLLPACEGHPYGALLALGSGSRPNRRTGALLGLDAQGAVRDVPRTVDLSPLLGPLDDILPKLNIEGAVVSGDEVSLFQRGNTRHADNAIVRFPLSALLDVVLAGRTIALKPTAIVRFDLGQIDGVPFSFTDAAALPDGSMIFSAVAENTADAYDDGPCTGAAIGMVDRSGELSWMHPLDRPHKVEGVDARIDDGVIRLLLVTDADDAATTAGLFSATIGR